MGVKKFARHWFSPPPWTSPVKGEGIDFSDAVGLIRFEVGRFNYSTPLRDFRLDISTELRGRAAHGFGAFLHEALSDIGQREHDHGCGIRPGDYFARRAGWKQQSVPCGGFEFRIA